MKFNVQFCFTNANRPMDCIVVFSVASFRSMPRSAVDLFFTRLDVIKLTSAPVSNKAMTSSLLILILRCGLFVCRSVLVVPITVKRVPFSLSSSGSVFVSGPTTTISSLAGPLESFPNPMPHFW